MTFLDFEKPIEELHQQLEKLRQVAEKSKVPMEDKLMALEEKIREAQKDLYSNLSGWQRVQLSRHPDRPYTLDYIERICDKWIELFGDRQMGDDKAMIGGLASIDGHSVLIVGQQKGNNTKMRQYRNFGMANPEGYRKALRLFKLAEKFSLPIICLIDTPGAYPGIEAEERGQAEAIARNLFEMSVLKTPTISYIIGEGASGGALGIGVTDRIFMLENTWYTVISPESCSSILWRSWDYKEQAAEALKLTATDMHKFKIVDGIVKEPLGGAHSNHDEMAKILKKHILKNIDELKAIQLDELLQQRLEKFSSIGFYKKEEATV